MIFKNTGKNGALTAYTIECDDAENVREMVKEITTYSTFVTATGIEGSGSRADVQKIEAMCLKSNNNNVVKLDTPFTEREVVSLATAQQLGLRCGKAWVCGDIDIETKGAHPALEGELICYCYR